MPSQCMFELNGRPKEVYYAGKGNIEGYITLQTSSDKDITKIKLRFRGKSKCGYSKMEDNPQAEPRGVYVQSKNIITKTSSILEGDKVLRAGSYSWPFSFQVGEDWPTSVEGPFGHIRYEISLKIYNKEKPKDVFIKPITIIKEDNLNLKPEYEHAVAVPVHSFINCVQFQNKPHFEFKSKYGGYAPGQFLFYSLELQQACIQEFSIKLIRRSLYKVDNPLSDENVEEIIFIDEFRLPDHPIISQSIENAFPIPCTPPTMSAKYISIQYFLAVSAKVACCDRKLKAELEIHIGTVPLKESLSSVERQSMIEYINDDPDDYIIKPGGYQKSDPYYTPFVDTDNEPINRFDGFLPTYPMFYYHKDM